MKQQGTTRLAEQQITKLIQDDEISMGQAAGEFEAVRKLALKKAQFWRTHRQNLTIMHNKQQ